MNIFKVIASGKKGFPEEIASAILAWFLNPYMEHGLGEKFLIKFLEAIDDKKDGSYFSFNTASIRLKLRDAFVSASPVSMKLEDNISNRFMDIVVFIDKNVIAIENKIRAESLEQGQLAKEYDGLKNKYPEYRINMVYLVPGCSLKDPEKMQTEYGSLLVEDNDSKSCITWQNESDAVPSISQMIATILEGESRGLIDPIDGYTRHTLKAFNSFIVNEFSGYEYDRRVKQTGLNPKTEDTLGKDELLGKDSGFVGISGGVSGLISSNLENLNVRKFQYTTQDMEGKPNWFDISSFKKLFTWLGNTSLKSNFDWDGYFSSKNIYRIAKADADLVFIGIRGGEKALIGMSVEDVLQKRWKVSNKKETDQWISGSQYVEILNSKGFGSKLNSQYDK